MRVSNLDLSWFRGAAAAVSLKADQKSMVIYGCNGSGKSTFVDAFEYILNGGKISHLAHEYSGFKQERGIINTHKPATTKTQIKLTFSNGAAVEYQIADNGAFKKDDHQGINPEAWDIDKVLLRHADLSEFIASAKSQKYNTLLPLLGLHSLEVYAQNIRSVRKAVEAESKISVQEHEYETLASSWKVKFGQKKLTEITDEILTLYNIYADKPVKKTHADIVQYATDLKKLLDDKLANSNSVVRTHSAFIRVQGTAVLDKLDDLKKIDVSVLQDLGSLIHERLEILEASGQYAEKIKDKDEIDCPSCGTTVKTEEYKKHLLQEQENLKSALTVLRQRKAALLALANALQSLIQEVRGEDLKDWVQNEEQKDFEKIIAHVKTYNLEALKQEGLDTKDFQYLQEKLPLVYEKIGEQAKKSPPEVVKLNADLEIAKTALTYEKIENLRRDIKQLKKAPQFLEKLEEVVRLEIKTRTQDQIDLISADIQKYWNILHPSKPIKDIKLYMPDDSIKGIDISLEFYGVSQDSPRLTLSEGYRNSLALCIFLALSKQEEKSQKPIILDDVVISFDREHRRQVIYLIQQEFSSRQIMIFTHDREWFAELKTFLDSAEWQFKTLGYWQSPVQGVVWSDKEGGISDAEIFLKNGDPEKAVQHARAYLDVSLSIISDKLQIKMPYIRGENNDRRTGAVFLESLIKEAKESFKIQSGVNKYEAFKDAVIKWEETRQLLIVDANRGAHGGVVSNTEAAALIQSCEEALAYFKCGDCKQNIWKLEDQGGKFCQCKCGKYKWSY